MRRITALAILSALVISALPLAASAEQEYPQPPAISSFDELEDCLVGHAASVNDYYLDTQSSVAEADREPWANAPRYTVDQRNRAWVAALANTAVESLEKTGESPTLPPHSEANAANPGTHSIVHYGNYWHISGLEDVAEGLGMSVWSFLCGVMSQSITFIAQPVVAERLDAIAGRDLRYSVAVVLSDEVVKHWEDPELDSEIVYLMAQAWVEKPAGTDFVDTPANHIFVSDISALAASGVTKGCNPPLNTNFCPDDYVTRGQMAAFLARALGLESGKATFSDTAGNVFAADIAALADAGITKGCNPPQNTKFCPDAKVTRGQMAAFLARALDLPAGKATFSDTAGSVFAADIAALADAGITRGCNPPKNDRFCPDDYVTRGQMAAFLVRAGLAG